MAASPPFFNLIRAPVASRSRARSPARGRPAGPRRGPAASSSGSKSPPRSASSSSGSTPECAQAIRAVSRARTFGLVRQASELDPQRLHAPAGRLRLAPPLPVSSREASSPAPSSASPCRSSQIMARGYPQIARKRRRGGAVASGPIAKMTRCVTLLRRPSICTFTASTRCSTGPNKIEAMATRAAELGMPALGLTDHGVMNGAVEHYKACKEHGDQADPRAGGLPGRGSPRGPAAPGRGVERNHLTLLAAKRRGLSQPREAQLGRLPRGVRPREGEPRHGAAGATPRA